MNIEKILATVLFVLLLPALFWLLHWLDQRDDDQWPLG